MTKIRRLVVITSGLLVLLLALAGEGVLAGGPGGKWSLTGSMHKDREGHSATPLGNGEVLVAGGSVSSAKAPSRQQSSLCQAPRHSV